MVAHKPVYKSQIESQSAINKSQTAFLPGNLKAQLKELPETKRENFTGHGVSDEDIEKRLFKLFERYEFYSMKDIYESLKLPQSRIKPVLIKIAEICMYSFYVSSGYTLNLYRG